MPKEQIPKQQDNILMLKVAKQLLQEITHMQKDGMQQHQDLIHMLKEDHNLMVMMEE